MKLGFTELPTVAGVGSIRLSRGPALHMEIQALAVLHPEIYESFCFNTSMLAYLHWPK